jgi:hypothetical protein
MVKIYLTSFEEPRTEIEATGESFSLAVIAFLTKVERDFLYIPNMILTGLAVLARCREDGEEDSRFEHREMSPEDNFDLSFQEL